MSLESNPQRPRARTGQQHAGRRRSAATRPGPDVFSQIVEQAPFGIYVVDSELRIQATNSTTQAAARDHLLIGRNLSEIMRILWPEPVVLDAIDRFRQTLATG